MRVRRNLAALLAAPCLLSACGGGSTSVADPPVSSHPTSSAPTTQPPAHESPEHFIRRFAAVERRMENTGKLAAYVRLTQSCQDCLDLAHQVRGFYQAGGYVHWRGWRIKNISPYTSGRDNNAFAVEVDSAPTAYRESSGGPIKHLEGGPATEIVTLKKSDNSWLVIGRARLGS
jgi:hypothetical protein